MELFDSFSCLFRSKEGKSSEESVIGKAVDDVKLFGRRKSIEGSYCSFISSKASRKKENEPECTMFIVQLSGFPMAPASVTRCDAGDEYKLVFGLQGGGVMTLESMDVIFVSSKSELDIPTNNSI